jgi:hypothetical protein
MKKISLVLFTVLCFLACKKNVDTTVSTPETAVVVPEAAVPTTVLTSFNASFSSSTEREWRHTPDDRFICQFNLDDQRHEADFDKTGNETKHNVICLDAAVPSVVINAFTAAFPSDLVYEWSLTNEGTWKAHFLRGSEKWEATFNGDGTIIKSEHD